MIKTNTLNSIEEIIEILKTQDNFVITFHINPDYDAVGSSLAVYKVLKNLGKNAIVVSEEKKETFEKIFSFLPNWEVIKNYEELEKIDLKYYTLIVLDSGELKRIGKNLQKLSNQFKCIINIDHHHDNEIFGTYNLVNSEAVGTGELIYILAKKLIGEIDKELATLLYASIVGDGGSFRFDSVKPSTHRITAELLETGIKPSFFTINMFQNKSIEFIKFEGELFQNLKECCNRKVVWVVITDELLRKYGILENETEPVVEDIGRIKEAIVYFTIKEKKEKNIITVALRSKGEFDVSKIARKLGGGGHKNASGVSFDISTGIEEVERIVVQEISEAMKKF